MINRLATVMSVCLALAAARAAAADKPAAELPADGWWVRYFLTAAAPGSDEEWAAKRTYALVGTSVEDGKKCRWVELKSVETVSGKEQIDIIKFLIPEKALLEDERPLDSLVRAWRKINDNTVEEQKYNSPPGTRGFSGTADFAWGRDFVIFPGPRSKAETVQEAKVVKFQKGRLEIADGRAGKHVATRRALTTGDEYSISIKFTVWNHLDVAPAFAAATTRYESRRNGELRGDNSPIEWLLEDFGTDAKTALPDHH